MKNLLSLLMGTRLVKVLTISFASVLLLFSTACSRADAADTMGLKANAGSKPNPPGQVQPYQGGMNNFSDVDPTRLDTKSVDAKAKALRDSVQRNIDEKGIDSVDQYVENYRSGTPLNERIENIGDDVRDTADNIKGNLKEFGKRGPKNVERNVDRASGNVSDTVEQAKANTQAAGEDISRGAKEPVDKAGKALNRAGEFAQDKASDSAKAVKRAVD